MPGDLKVFADEEQIRQIEARMKKRGYLEGHRMANAFNMLRPNDLIWSYVVNNYIKGKTPMAFDLLYWNADATRMPAANHSFYLRNCYLENTLAQGRMVLGNVRLDLKKVKVPIFNLATREDHIAPALSVFEGLEDSAARSTTCWPGSGHIAGVVNPPAKPKYGFWTGGPVEGHGSRTGSRPRPRPRARGGPTGSSGWSTRRPPACRPACPGGDALASLGPGARHLRADEGLSAAITAGGWRGLEIRGCRRSDASSLRSERADPALAPDRSLSTSGRAGPAAVGAAGLAEDVAEADRDDVGAAVGDAREGDVLDVVVAAGAGQDPRPCRGRSASRRG